MAVFFQQIRFAFKNLKRYILEKDIKFLSHWDIVSVFAENVTKKAARKQIKSEFICEELVEERLRHRKMELKLNKNNSTARSENEMQLKRPENLIEHLLNSDDESPPFEPVKKNKSSMPHTVKINPISDRQAVISDLVSEIE